MAPAVERTDKSPTWFDAMRLPKTAAGEKSETLR